MGSEVRFNEPPSLGAETPPLRRPSPSKIAGAPPAAAAAESAAPADAFEALGVFLVS